MVSLKLVGGVLYMKPKVLIVGTYHFGGSLDYIQNDTGNLLSEQRQKEIIDVVERLSKFNPSKVTVEQVKEKSDALNNEYNNYIQGTFISK